MENSDNWQTLGKTKGTMYPCPMTNNIQQEICYTSGVLSISTINFRNVPSKTVYNCIMNGVQIMITVALKTTKGMKQFCYTL